MVASEICGISRQETLVIKIGKICQIKIALQARILALLGDLHNDM